MREGKLVVGEGVGEGEREGEWECVCKRDIVGNGRECESE